MAHIRVLGPVNSMTYTVTYVTGKMGVAENLKKT